MFLSGSPALEIVNGIRTGRLSGIVNHHVPAYLRRDQLPSYSTNVVEDWETKLDHIVEGNGAREHVADFGHSALGADVFRQARATPPAGRVRIFFPDFSLFVYGGVNFEPYRKKLFDTIGPGRGQRGDGFRPPRAS